MQGPGTVVWCQSHVGAIHIHRLSRQDFEVKLISHQPAALEFRVTAGLITMRTAGIWMNRRFEKVEVLPLIACVTFLYLQYYFKPI